MRAFINALITEADFAKDKLTIPPETLYLGGGTPSMLSPTHLRQLFDGLRKKFDFKTLNDITLEANPATFDLAKAQLFRELGVTRVSLGIQSFTEKTLQTLGRDHSPQQAAEAVKILQAAGLPSINIDLMFSIPGQSLNDWQHDLETAVSLKPDHISAYNLTYEEDTAFFDSLKKGQYQENPDLNADCFNTAHQALTQAGFSHYETSNYARKGHESTHNKGYWHGHDYLGLGPSAVSTLSAERENRAEKIRHQNVPDTAAYIQQIGAVGHAMTNIEELDASDLRTERIALMLRTATGLPLHFIQTVSNQVVDELITAGYAQVNHDHLALTQEGQPLVDEIAVQLL